MCSNMVLIFVMLVCSMTNGQSTTSSNTTNTDKDLLSLFTISMSVDGQGTGEMAPSNNGTGLDIDIPKLWKSSGIPKSSTKSNQIMDKDTNKMKAKTTIYTKELAIPKTSRFEPTNIRQNVFSAVTGQGVPSQFRVTPQKQVAITTPSTRISPPPHISNQLFSTKRPSSKSLFRINSSDGVVIPTQTAYQRSQNPGIHMVVHPKSENWVPYGTEQQFSSKKKLTIKKSHGEEILTGLGENTANIRDGNIVPSSKLGFRISLDKKTRQLINSIPALSNNAESWNDLKDLLSTIAGDQSNILDQTESPTTANKQQVSYTSDSNSNPDLVNSSLRTGQTQASDKSVMSGVLEKTLSLNNLPQDSMDTQHILNFTDGENVTEYTVNTYRIGYKQGNPDAVELVNVTVESFNKSFSNILQLTKAEIDILNSILNQVPGTVGTTDISNNVFGGKNQILKNANLISDQRTIEQYTKDKLNDQNSEKSPKISKTNITRVTIPNLVGRTNNFKTSNNGETAWTTNVNGIKSQRQTIDSMVAIPQQSQNNEVYDLSSNGQTKASSIQSINSTVRTITKQREVIDQDTGKVLSRTIITTKDIVIPNEKTKASDSSFDNVASVSSRQVNMGGYNKINTTTYNKQTDFSVSNNQINSVTSNNEISMKGSMEGSMDPFKNNPDIILDNIINSTLPISNENSFISSLENKSTDVEKTIMISRGIVREPFIDIKENQIYNVDSISNNDAAGSGSVIIINSTDNVNLSKNNNYAQNLISVTDTNVFNGGNDGWAMGKEINNGGSQIFSSKSSKEMTVTSNTLADQGLVENALTTDGQFLTNTNEAFDRSLSSQIQASNLDFSSPRDNTFNINEYIPTSRIMDSKSISSNTITDGMSLKKTVSATGVKNTNSITNDIIDGTESVDNALTSGQQNGARDANGGLSMTNVDLTRQNVSKESMNSIVDDNMRENYKNIDTTVGRGTSIGMNGKTIDQNSFINQKANNGIAMNEITGSVLKFEPGRTKAVNNRMFLNDITDGSFLRESVNIQKKLNEKKNVGDVSDGTFITEPVIVKEETVLNNVGDVTDGSFIPYPVVIKTTQIKNNAVDVSDGSFIIDPVEVQTQAFQNTDVGDVTDGTFIKAPVLIESYKRDNAVADVTDGTFLAQPLYVQNSQNIPVFKKVHDISDGTFLTKPVTIINRSSSSSARIVKDTTDGTFVTKPVVVNNNVVNDNSVNDISDGTYIANPVNVQKNIRQKDVTDGKFIRPQIYTSINKINQNQLKDVSDGTFLVKPVNSILLPTVEQAGDIGDSTFLLDPVLINWEPRTSVGVSSLNNNKALNSFETSAMSSQVTGFTKTSQNVLSTSSSSINRQIMESLDTPTGGTNDLVNVISTTAIKNQTVINSNSGKSLNVKEEPLETKQDKIILDESITSRNILIDNTSKNTDSSNMNLINDNFLHGDSSNTNTLQTTEFHASATGIPMPSGDSINRVTYTTTNINKTFNSNDSRTVTEQDTNINPKGSLSNQLPTIVPRHDSSVTNTFLKSTSFTNDPSYSSKFMNKFGAVTSITSTSASAKKQENLPGSSLNINMPDDKANRWIDTPTVYTQDKATRKENCNCPSDAKKRVLQTASKAAAIGDRSVVITKIPSSNIFQSDGQNMVDLSGIFINPILQETIPVEGNRINFPLGQTDRNRPIALLVTLYPSKESAISENNIGLTVDPSGSNILFDSSSTSGRSNVRVQENVGTTNAIQIDRQSGSELPYITDATRNTQTNTLTDNFQNFNRVVGLTMAQGNTDNRVLDNAGDMNMFGETPRMEVPSRTITERKRQFTVGTNAVRSSTVSSSVDPLLPPINAADDRNRLENVNQIINERLITSISSDQATSRSFLLGLCRRYLDATVESITLAPFPGDCSRLVKCEDMGRDIQYTIKKCPLGLFFDSETQSCKDPQNVPCPDDLCLKGVSSYPGNMGCRSYYACQGGLSNVACCPRGQRYIVTGPGQGQCVADPRCTDTCTSLSEMKLGVCRTVEVQSNPQMYWDLSPSGAHLQECPDGTRYRPRDCSCLHDNSIAGNWPSETIVSGCQPEFHLISDNDRVTDISDGGLAFEQRQITVKNSAIQFRGNSRINIWGFNNRHLGNSFAIHIRVKPQTLCDYGPQALLSNCGPMGQSSVEIACQNGQIVFKAETTLEPEIAVIAKNFKLGKWLDIRYVFNGRQFSGMVDGENFRIPLSGNLEPRNNPLMIGKCQGSPGFLGEIIKLAIYTECIPEGSQSIGTV